MATIREMLLAAVKLHRAGELAQAEQMYRGILQQEPRHPDALNLLGVIANQSSKPEVAVDFFERAIAVQPGEAEFHHNLGGAFKSSGNVSAAVAAYREALRLRPDFAPAHIYLSDALMEQGNFAQALAHSLEALRLKPDSALAYCTLGELAGQNVYAWTEADIQNMQALLAGGQQSTHDQSLLCFTLAAHWEKQGAYDEAFRYYRQANDRKAEVYRDSNKTFDRQQHRELIDRLIAVFTPEFFARTRSLGIPSAQPVFVVGMVRSGTSLVEQILASLPSVFGAGELRDIDQISAALPHRLNVLASYPECMIDIRPAIVQTVADLYLQRLARLSGGPARRVIDKMPHNYLHLGLISVLFPDSRVIHCQRNMLDVCVSAYLQNFKWLPYAASMEDIGFYYRQYERLMAHWRRVLPLPMHEVAYEQLVTNQEPVSRALIAFCGLDWDDCCLAFDKSSRTVQTASKLQVRQPIHTRSVERWKRFEKHLEPLRDALANS